MEASISFKNFPAAPTNGYALFILIFAGGLADKHYVRVRIAITHDELCGLLGQFPANPVFQNPLF
jgi:hypothetical protein